MGIDFTEHARRDFAWVSVFTEHARRDFAWVSSSTGHARMACAWVSIPTECSRRDFTWALTTQSHLESIQDRIKLAEPQLIVGRQHACMSQVVGEHHLLHLEMIWFCCGMQVNKK